MVTHFFTLYALCKELQEYFCNALIEEIFTQQKDELYITFTSNRGGYTLSTSVDPSVNHFYLRDTVHRAKKNSVDLFPSLVGKTIARVGMIGFDRTVAISFEESSDALFLQLYNSARSNIFLVDKERAILHSFKRGKEFEGALLPSPHHAFDESLLENKTEWMNALVREDAPIQNALKKLLPIFGSTYVRETLFRAGVEEAVPSAALDEHMLENIFNAAREIYRERETPHPAIFLRDNKAAVLSIMPLRHLAGAAAETFENINTAVKTCLSRRHKSWHTDDGKKDLLGKLKTVVERNQKTIEALDRQMKETSRAGEYERFGNIILGNLGQATKGMTTIELPDIVSDAGPVNIAIDPKLSPIQNAKRYFDKAKKAKLAMQEGGARLREAKEELSRLQQMLTHLDVCRTPAEVKQFIEQFRKELVKMHLLKEGKRQEQLPFRVFAIIGGFEVWVGKSSSSNDLLTMKYAKPNDLWFHARGASGSHTVLKVRDANHPPGKEAIHQAAAIAAYYSKMRKASNVPVAYCERKYVKKSKGLAEGTVILEREKVIFVTPRLP